MNKFSAYIKGANSNVYNQQIDGVSTFTFAKSALLDERLDEAYLYLEQSETPSFEPTTEIAILVRDENNNEKTYRYVIASDRSQEQPNGSGYYKHEIHLIERTKLLEGIYCSSLTFTNSKGNTYTNNKRQSMGAITYSGVQASFSDNEKQSIENYLKKLFLSPVENSSVVVAGENWSTIPSATSLADYLSGVVLEEREKYQNSLSDDDELTISTQSTSVTYTNDEQPPTTEISTELIIKYNLHYQLGTDPTKRLSIEFDYTIAGVQNQYPLKPWTITECVVRCLQLAEPIIQVDLSQEPAPRFTFNAEQAQKYANVYAPEFTMTQCTLREQLKVIGSYIHAEPRLGGYDANGVYRENYIFFDEYGQGSKASIEDKPYIYKAFNHDINEYCTHIETSASNLVNALDYAQGVVTEPNINNNRTLRTESINVILSEGNSFASTDNAIYDIPNQEGGVLVTLYDGDNAPIFEDVDITPFIFEETEYNNLSSFGGGYPYSKHYALYYKRGQKGIHGLFFKVDNAVNEIFSNYAIVNIINSVTGGNYKGEIAERFAQLAFKITYVPIYDTKFSHSKQTVKLGKKPFSRVYNQSENVIESRFYGENVKGTAQRMGNIEQTRTYILDSIDDIPEIGQTIDRYFIVDVKCEFQQGFIKCTVQLSKDFNRISQYVGISSNKRVYEVSEVNAYARDILLKNYVVVGDSTDTTIANGYTPILNTIAPIMQMFNPNIDGKVNAPINAVNGYGLTKALDVIGNVSLPVISSAFGNTMVFSWDYKDNYSAGTQASAIDDAIYDPEDNSKTIIATWQRDVAYGDYYGRCWWYKFRMYTNPSDMGYSQATTVEQQDKQQVSNIGLYSNALLLRKDNRERLSFNYEVEFVTTHDDIIIGSALASSCPLVTTRRYGNLALVFLNRKVGKFERYLTVNNAQATGNYIIDESMVSANGANGTLILPLSYQFAPDDFDFESWAIVTPIINKSQIVENEDGTVQTITIQEGGEILLARNKSKAQYGNATTETIKFQIANTIFDR